MYALLMLLCLAALPVLAANPADKIRAVEHSLLPAAVTKDRPLPFMSLVARLEYYGVPGVSLAIIDGDSLTWARGYGVRQSKVQDPLTEATLFDAWAKGSTQVEPVSVATLFQTGSLSQAVAAALALRLVEEGLLELDEDLSSRMRSWKVPSSLSDRPFTLRLLLSHRAGLNGDRFLGLAINQPRPALPQVLDSESAAEPGRFWGSWTNSFALLQHLVAERAGQPFAEVAQEKIFGPLGMERSTFAQPLPARLAGSAASGHLVDGMPLEHGWHTLPPSAGLWTTPSDLARFVLELQRAHQGLSSRVLSPEMARLMLSPGEQGWGLGLRAAADSFSGEGASQGFVATFFAYKERGQGAVVMTNAGAGDELCGEILRAVAQVYDWPDFRPLGVGPPRRIALQVIPATLPEEATVYLTGHHRLLDYWSPLDLALELQPDSSWSDTFRLEEGSLLEYRITRGTLASQAVGPNGRALPPALLEVKGDTALTIFVDNWKDLYKKGRPW
jgi:CubicO group peptidase (beta-lactamase class C family)